jgi:hypothetical protein
MKYLINSIGQIIIADLAFVEAHYPGDFTEIEEPPAPVPTVRVLSKVTYLKRFTQTERINIRAAAAANPVVDDYVQLLNLTSEVDLDDPDTVGGANALEAAGLLEAGRAAEILA